MRAVLLAAPLALALAACASPGTRTVEVSMTDELRFEPGTIEVAAGETVRFEVTNVGQSVHEFLIGDEGQQAAFAEEMAEDGMAHDSDAGVSVEPGEIESFEYTFDKGETDLLAGCHEPGHYDAGMVASITVTD